MNQASALLESRRVELPEAGGTPAVAPGNEEELASILGHATHRRLTVGIWGGGTHRGIGRSPRPDLVVSTQEMSGIEEWEPDDLTVVVGAGTPVAELEGKLAGGRQSAVLPERPGRATVGGVVAAGVSGYRRLRYGPTRDRLLEVRAVTGDGRSVKGGGRVVKNVTGYDLPRLFTGSLGSLGVITSVCLKLWPLTEMNATVRLADPDRAALIHRPLAVLRTPESVDVFLSGTGPEVEEQVARLQGDVSEGLAWPEPPLGEVVWSVRVRPRHLDDMIDLLPRGVAYVAQLGVGEVSFGTEAVFDVGDLRHRIEQLGGSLVRLCGGGDQDPWGTPPAGLDLQRRVMAAFDPARILEPGRLPGGI